MWRRLSVQTSGESHGRGMIATVTGVPAGVPIDTDAIDAMLKRRQGGFGRSSRQQLEDDRVDVLAGAYRGKTTGAPLSLAVWNKDDSLDERPPVWHPRPGHADLAGGQKYGTHDMRPVLERASARETAARVAAGALAAGLLAELEVRVFAHVTAIGAVSVPPPRGRADLDAWIRRRDRSPFAVLVPGVEARLKAAVLAARKAGDTLGGSFAVEAHGVPAGLGAPQDPGARLDARLGAALLSIPAMVGVEIGDGVASSRLRGSAVHDELARPGRAGPRRRSNRAGGIEGGISNGEPIRATAYMKPLPTLRRPLASWDFRHGKPAEAFYERADVTAVPAGSVVGEAMVALVLADALLEKTGGDSLAEVRRALAAHRRAVARRFGRRD